MMKKLFLLITLQALFFLANPVSANEGENTATIFNLSLEDEAEDIASTEAQKEDIHEETLKALSSFVKQKNNLEKEIALLKQKIQKTVIKGEKAELNIQLIKLKETLHNTQVHLKEIAAGIDISNLSEQKVEAFEFQKEVLALLKPIIDEVKDMTSEMRQKTALKEKVIYYGSRLPTINSAISNITLLQKQSKNKDINVALEITKQTWEKQRSLMLSEQQAAELQLNKILLAEKLADASATSWVKTFFQKRGLYLSEALLVVVLVLFISKAIYSAMQRYLPGFKAQHRSFKIRLLELIHKFLTGLFLILGPMIVFYLVEDWVLFSLGILLLIGIGWTLRQALPHYWNQINLFLNIGSAREGERIELDGLPWQIHKINVFCTLVNPMAKIEQRIPLKDLVDKISRPYERDEPWFPCRKDDWVILSDGVRGMVIGISQEMVQLVERGGTRKTYLTQDFLANSPRNLSINFRIKEKIGISYNLQKQSTHQIPDMLVEFINLKAEEEGFANDLLSLKVEFEVSNDSSLGLVVIADFNGEIADLYNRLRRRIQRWCVEACTEHQWEIPYPQLTLHNK